MHEPEIRPGIRRLVRLALGGAAAMWVYIPRYLPDHDRPAEP